MSIRRLIQGDGSARPAGSSERTFGGAFAAFFLVVGLLPLWNDRPVRAWALAAAALFFAAAVGAPRVLAPLNRLWMRFGELLNRIVSPVVLAIVFYGVVTPTAIAMRVLGKDPLRLRRDPQTRTYWIEREPPGPPADSLKNQF